MIEGGGTLGQRRRLHAVGLNGAAETGKAAVGTGDHFPSQDHRTALVGPAAGMLAREASARSERADQRHLAGVVLLETNYARQRLACDLPRIDTEQFGEVR